APFFGCRGGACPARDNERLISIRAGRAARAAPANRGMTAGSSMPAGRIPRPSGRPMTLRVHSEIGKLSSVLVHLPGLEIDRMVPAMMEELLFDDILFGARAREEHRRFQQVLGYVADEVLDARDLLAEVLAVPEHRAAVMEDLARELLWPPDMGGRLRDLSADDLASALVTGIEKPPREASQSSSELYWLPPVPNYFFQRDPLVVVGDRVIR